MISRSIKISPGSPVLRSSFVNYGPVFPLEPWVLAISCNMARLSAMVAHFSSAWLTTAVAFALRGLGRWFLVLLVLGGFWHLHGQADVKKWIRTVCKLSAIGGSGQCCNIFWRCDDLNKRLGNSLDFASVILNIIGMQTGTTNSKRRQTSQYTHLLSSLTSPVNSPDTKSRVAMMSQSFTGRSRAFLIINNHKCNTKPKLVSESWCAFAGTNV